MSLDYIYIYIIINHFYYTYCKNNTIYLLYYIGECVDRLIDIVCVCTCITWWPLEQVIKCRQNEVEREGRERERVGREREGGERKGRGCMVCLSIHEYMFSEI